MPASTAAIGAFGSEWAAGASARAPAEPDAVAPGDGVTAPTAGRTSYARRLIFRRCRGEMLSDVMFPPHPPHPRVMAGSNPVVSPIDPCVVGVFTQMRKAGFRRPNSKITLSFCEWMDMVWPMPPYRRIWMHRSHPARQSLTTYQDSTGQSFSIDSG